MTETKYNPRGVPLLWATSDSEAKHWRQFTIEDLRKMVAKRYAVTPLELSSMTREALIFAIEQWAAKSAGKREAV